MKPVVLDMQLQGFGVTDRYSSIKPYLMVTFWSFQ